MVDALAFYARPGAMTAAGAYAAQLAGLPTDVAGLVEIVQGLLLHEHAAPEYGVTLSEERKLESHTRAVARMLETIHAHDGRPLVAPRPLAKRTVGVCRHFVVLLVTILRAQGIPARARCGFATYFKSGHYDDHWLCECWNAQRARWMRVDPQLDDVQRRMLGIDFAPLDVPSDRFLPAGEAWTLCRTGNADHSRFGVFDLRGLWFVAGNLVRDVAALNKVEMLPWDVWGAMPFPGEPVNSDRLELFNDLSTLTREPDQAFDRLRWRYQDDERLRVPTTVFNAVLDCRESIDVQITRSDSGP